MKTGKTHSTISKKPVSRPSFKRPSPSPMKKTPSPSPMKKTPSPSPFKSPGEQTGAPLQGSIGPSPEYPATDYGYPQRRQGFWRSSGRTGRSGATIWIIAGLLLGGVAILGCVALILIGILGR